jgi:tetratricopeptide (TPR) repeat protein
LRERAEKKRLFYTSIRAGLSELLAMEKIGNPEMQLILVKRLLKKLEKKKSPDNAQPTLHFLLLTGKAKALADLGRIKDVLPCIKKCEYLCRYLSDAKFYRKIAFLYSAIKFYKKSLHWIKKSLGCSEDRYRSISYQYLAGNLTIAGEYRAARKILKGIELDTRGALPLAAMINACCSFGEGKIQEAAQYANEALRTSREQGILDYLLISSLMLAYCSCGLNEREKAISRLKRLALQIKKLGSNTALFFIKALLGQSSFPRNTISIPNIKLILLLREASKSLRIGDYRKAFNYAVSQQLMGLFHRSVLFFPESVNKLISKGKSTGLPKALLKLPVFQKDIPVYHLMFLGPVRVYRNGIRLRDNPTPMYASFNIHLGFKKKIELNSLYRNFWSHAKNPRGSLSHLLFGLRTYLKLPPNTLFIKQRFLYFKGYITTDYQFYEETITRAKALERAGEWGFAKKEYLRAFKLFRGEPFCKMYDPWSEHMRRVILNKLENTALEFAKRCLEHRNRADARRVLEKVAKIIPQSEEIEKMVREYGGNGVSEKRRIQKTYSH